MASLIERGNPDQYVKAITVYRFINSETKAFACWLRNRFPFRHVPSGHVPSGQPAMPPLACRPNPSQTKNWSLHQRSPAIWSNPTATRFEVPGWGAPSKA